MQGSESIAILIRHADHLSEGLRTGERFCLAGMKVAVYVIGDELPASDEGACPDMASRPAMHTELYSCHPADEQRFGFDTLTVGQMAERLADADLVISF